MGVTRLQLTNFRSYADRTIPLDPAITLVIGPNATGKTNLLEALYVLATTKSFRARDTELVRHGQDHYRVAAQVDGITAALGYQSTGQSSEKRVRHDDVPRSLIDHLGTLRAVLFEPNDLLIIHGAPDRRRRYLDGILSQTDKAFVRTLNRYRQVLQQRNRLLSNWRGDNSELFAWNVQLAELAAEIDARRRALIGHIAELAAGRYNEVAGAAERLELTYQGATDGPSDYPTHFLQLLEQNQARDLAAGFTTTGPHRDDFTISFKEAPITSVASRGEMRTVVLALKLAELAYIEQRAGAKPLLLLDDVFSELDDARRRYLLATLGDYQSVITTTNADVDGELSARHATIHTIEFAGEPTE